jgi:hypothetical protein
VKNPKSILLLIFVLVLVTISFLLVSFWGYNYYFKNKVTTNSDSTLLINKIATRDSLQAVLDNTILLYEKQPHLISSSGSDSLDKMLEEKLAEYNKVKGQIVELLKNKSSAKDGQYSENDVDKLQQNVDELRSKNEEIQKENLRLAKMVKELNSKPRTTADITKNVKPKKTFSNSPSKVSTELPLLISDLKFQAVHLNEGSATRTTLAAEADQFRGSLKLNILNDQDKSSSIYVVIVQPNGRVLLNTAWESGTFVTPFGKKIYSAVLHFDGTKDNNKLVPFSISADQFQKGKYTMQIYHNGKIIGTQKKTLF